MSYFRLTTVVELIKTRAVLPLEELYQLLFVDWKIRSSFFSSTSTELLVQLKKYVHLYREDIKMLLSYIQSGVDSVQLLNAQPDSFDFKKRVQSIHLTYQTNQSDIQTIMNHLDKKERNKKSSDWYITPYIQDCFSDLFKKGDAMVKELLDDYEVVKTYIINLQTQSSTSAKQVSNYHPKLSELQKEVADKQTRIDRLEIILKEERDERAELASELEELKAQVQSSQPSSEQQEALRQAQERAEHFEREYKGSQKALEYFSSQQLDMQSEINTQQASIDSLTAKNRSLQDEIISLKAELQKKTITNENLSSQDRVLKEREIEAMEQQAHADHLKEQNRAKELENERRRDQAEKEHQDHQAKIAQQELARKRAVMEQESKEQERTANLKQAEQSRKQAEAEAQKAQWEKLSSLSELSLEQFLACFKTHLEASDRQGFQGNTHSQVLDLHLSIKDAFVRHRLTPLDELEAIAPDVHRINQEEAVLKAYREKIRNIKNDPMLQEDEEELQEELEHMRRLRDRAISKIEEH